jgi:hypothetical protein
VNLPELNALLGRAKLPSLPSWTPPAAPACGPSAVVGAAR